MIDLGSSDFLIKIPNLPRDDFERYSNELFDLWEESVEKTLNLPDYSISLEIEEGSIKGRGKVAATAGALYIGIGLYGDFIGGLETISDQVSTVTGILYENARAPFGGTNSNSKLRRSGGALSKLKGLFTKVQNGDLSADEAMLQVERIFGDDSDEAKKLIEELKNELENAPRYPKQMSLDDEEWDEGNEVERPLRILVERPKPEPIPQPDQYRIEIWRRSKKGKKRMKIVRL